jgi:preprotein translocase subunit SecF
MNFPFLKFSKAYFFFSGALVLASVFAIIFWGLNWGIDFVGGSVLRMDYRADRPSQIDISEELNNLGLENFTVRLNGEKGVAVRIAGLVPKKQEELSHYFYEHPEVERETIIFESVSPIIGKETKGKARTAIIFSVIAIVLYVAFVFRKVSRPVSSWQYGIATVIALSHDVLIPVGLFALLGHWKGIEFSIPILTAILTIFGYSVNDTVVVFDRVRENLIRGGYSDFQEAADKSLNQTLIRSINTSFTTLLVLLAIYFFGGQSLSYFSLALIAGVLAGTYSSMFLAVPLLVFWLRIKHKT